jgi:hypothetical protein
MDMGNSSFGRCGAGVLIHPAANIQQPLANVNQRRAGDIEAELLSKINPKIRVLNFTYLAYV